MKKICFYIFALLAAVSCNLDGMQTLRGKYSVPDIPLHSEDVEITTEKEPGSIRLMQYNVGVFYKSGSSSLDMIISMMKELEVDVMALNEVDYMTNRTGKVDQLKDFATKMGGWNYKFAPALDPFNGGKYGVGACASPEFTFIKSDNITLPQSGGSEQRALAVMEFDKFIFATAHLDFPDVANLTQFATINNYFDTKYPGTTKPIFLTGDFNATPDREVIKEAKKTWTMISENGYTSNAISPSKCIDYIFMRDNGANVEVVKTKICKKFATGSVTTASDHLPVFVDVKL